MSQFDYAKSEATARRLLTKFGQPMEFKKDAPPPPPGVPDYGGTGGSSSGIGVLLGYENSEVDGSVIQQGDAKVIYTSNTGAPTIGMDATINEAKWRVITVEPLAPAGHLVLYKMQVRK